MSTPGNAGNARRQPDLGQLMARFLKQRSGEELAGTLIPADLTSEVETHQAGTATAIDPRMALEEATECVRFLDQELAEGFSIQSLKKLPDWAMLVRNHESHLAIPFCLGNFPQLMRSVSPLMQTDSFSPLRPAGMRPIPVSGVAEWGEQMLNKGRVAEALFAAAALRLAGQFPTATSLLTKIRDQVMGEYEDLLLNEEAALAWQQGRAEQAAERWAEHPQADSPVLLFNRGMAALFLDRLAEAKTLLAQAVEAIPESSSWHHLGRLYLTLAEGTQ